MEDLTDARADELPFLSENHNFIQEKNRRIGFIDTHCQRFFLRLTLLTNLHLAWL